MSMTSVPSEQRLPILKSVCRAVARFLLSVAHGVALRLLWSFVIVASLLVSIEAWVWFSRPPLIRGLAGGFIASGAPDAYGVYRARVAATFPRPIAEDQLVAELEKQGFIIPPDRPRRHAGHNERSFPCLISWIVQWRLDERGQASDIEGRRHLSCL